MAALVWMRTSVAGILTRIDKRALSIRPGSIHQRHCLATRRGAQSGFTLIEILTVIAAITALLSMVMFSLGSVGLRKANSLAKETSFLMQTLADEAIMTGQRYGLRIDSGGRRLAPVVLGGSRNWSGGASFEPIVWDADMQVRLESVDSLREYEGANFDAGGQQDDEDKKPASAIVFEPIGTWVSNGNSLVFLHDGIPVKRLIWTAIGRVEIENIDPQELN